MGGIFSTQQVDEKKILITQPEVKNKCEETYGKES
jgi:hypothetical protein